MKICVRCGIYNHDRVSHCKSCRLPLAGGADGTNPTKSYQTPLQPLQAGELVNVQQGAGVHDQPIPDSGHLDIEPESLQLLIEKNISSINTPETQSGVKQAAKALPGEQKVITKDVKRLGSLVLGVFVLITLAVLWTQREENTSLYEEEKILAEGENYFQSRNWMAASRSYWNIIENSSDKTKVGFAAERIIEIRNLEIDSLMHKAWVHFNNEQFLAPETENARFYILQVLAMDPNHQAAQDLKSQIASYYTKQAETSYRQQRFTDAISNFKNVLIVQPGNQNAREQISKIKVKIKNSLHRDYNAKKNRNKVNRSSNLKNPVNPSSRQRIKSNEQPSSAFGAFDKYDLMQWVGPRHHCKYVNNFLLS